MVPPDNGLGRIGRPNQLYKEKQMTALDIISQHMGLSTDEINSVLEEVNYVSFRLENNMDQFLEDRIDIELDASQIRLVGAFNGMLPQTPLSLVVRRVDGPNEAFVRRLLYICAYVADLIADSFQQCFDDDRLDMELEEFGVTEEQVQAAVLRAESYD
jgi:hypothetical protein